MKKKKEGEKIPFQFGPPGLDDARRAEIQEKILRYRENMTVGFLADYGIQRSVVKEILFLKITVYET